MYLTAQQWNARYPVGTPVRYRPFTGREQLIESRTKSEAWRYDGDFVVAIEGKGGSVSLARLEVIKR